MRSHTPQKVRPHTPCFRAKALLIIWFEGFCPYRAQRCIPLILPLPLANAIAVFGRSSNTAFYGVARLNMQSHSVIRSFISQHITLDRASSLAAPFTSTSDRWFWAKMVTVVTVTEVTVFSGGGIRDFENFQIVSNNNR